MIRSLLLFRIYRFFPMASRSFLSIFASSLALAPLTSCAPFPNSIKDATSRQSALVQATCAKVMRLQEGLAEYEGCVSSLSDSLAEKIQTDRGAIAFNDCTQTGLKRDTPEFSRCILDRENIQQSSNVPPTGTASHLGAAYVKPADNNPKDYFQTTFALRHSRELYACAELGLEPSSGAFAQCVTDLESSLFNIEHPPS